MPKAIVYGTGGSGTRAVIAALEAAGVNCGENLRAGEPSTKAFRDWVLYSCRERFAELVPSQQEIPGIGDAEVVKHPRLIFLAPYLMRHDPDLKAIHVIRDGRDMAFAANQGQFHAYKTDWLPEDFCGKAPENYARFWDVTNFWADQAVDGNRRCFIRFEDLCRHPTMIPDAALVPRDPGGSPGGGEGGEEAEYDRPVQKAGPRRGALLPAVAPAIQVP